VRSLFADTQALKLTGNQLALVKVPIKMNLSTAFVLKSYREAFKKLGTLGRHAVLCEVQLPFFYSMSKHSVGGQG
jgi:hypothetical protein